MVHCVSKPKYRSGNKNNRSGKRCGNCGYIYSKDKNKCPAKGKTCLKCRKVGHYASVCRSSPKEQSSTYLVKKNNNLQYIGLLRRPQPGAKCKFTMNNKSVVFQIDTGTSVNIIL